MSESTNNSGIINETDLIRRVREGDKRAENELYRRYLKSVEEEVRKLIRKANKDSEKNFLNDNFDALVNAGICGLFQACKTYDFQSGRGLANLAFKKYSYVWKAIDMEKWIQKGLRPDLAKHASQVAKERYRLEEEKGVTKLYASKIAKEKGIPVKRVEEILYFLESHRMSIEQDCDDGLSYDRISDKNARDPIELMEQSKREPYRWEFQHEDFGFIIDKAKRDLLALWKKTDSDRYQQFASDVRAPDRCLRRRVVFANGSRGMLDVSILEELNKYASGSDVYDRRRLWRDYSTL